MAFGTSDLWVGREQEIAVLRDAVDGLGRGIGAVVWIEGLPGIGKSALVAKAVEAARAAGHDVLTGAAEPNSRQSPLQVMLELLQVWPHSPDPRRRDTAAALSERRLGLLATAGSALTDIELLVDLVDELSTVAPMVLVVDDLHHLDELSFLLWHRLVAATNQLPLLLVTSVRPVPWRQEVQDLRAVVQDGGHSLLVLEPLTDGESEDLLTAWAGDLPAASRRQLSTLAKGNPFYLRELADAARRDGEMWEGRRSPASVAEVLTERLDEVPEQAAEMLRAAALLGGRFSIEDLVVLLRRPATELAPGLRAALAAGVVVEVEGQLDFRHPLLRRALYDAIPPALRAALHRGAACALDKSGAGMLRVAGQLRASGEPGDHWARGWLARNASVLAAHAPELVIELLSRESERGAAGDEYHHTLVVVLAWVLQGAGRYEEAAARARQALAVVAHSTHVAEMYFVLVRALFSLGRGVEAMDALRRALSRTDLSVSWRARLLVPLSIYQRAGEGDTIAAEGTAQQALQLAESTQDTFATAYALTALWTVQSVRRDHLAALASVDRALEVLSTGPEHADLRALALDGRIFTLQNLSRWRDAVEVLRHERNGGVHRAAGSRRGVTAAVLSYWLGDWDDALAELEPGRLGPAGFTYAGLREPGPALLWHGVGALIAARRDERNVAVERLGAGEMLPISTIGDRENRDFLVAARCVLREQDGDVQGAIASFAEMVLDRRPGEMSLTFQWLPDLVRLALEAGDREVVRAALAQAQAEATAETQPARAAAAALRCQGLAERDVTLLRAAAGHYRSAGPPIELAATLEDLAFVSAACGELTEGRGVLVEAVDLYGEFGAEWDIRRAYRRLREYGVHRGAPGPRECRDAFGWASLTPTELRIAELVADGGSTSCIATALSLSPRTVQTHISRVLGKLGARGRVEIAREVFRRRAER